MIDLIQSDVHHLGRMGMVVPRDEFGQSHGIKPAAGCLQLLRKPFGINKYFCWNGYGGFHTVHFNLGLTENPW